MHHNFPSGKINFDTQHHCSYCKSILDNNRPRDHFLLCPQSSDLKHIRIQAFNKIIQRWHTPPSLRTKSLLI